MLTRDINDPSLDARYTSAGISHTAKRLWVGFIYDGLCRTRCPPPTFQLAVDLAMEAAIAARHLSRRIYQMVRAKSLPSSTALSRNDSHITSIS